jgi:cytochrome c-type biogenesis protein CcmH
MTPSSSVPAPSRAASLLLPVGVVAIVAAAATFGWFVSRKSTAPVAAVAPPVASAQGGHSVAADQIDAMLGRLEARLAKQPDDAEGWSMLARSYAVLGRHQQALPAFERAVALRGDDAVLLADYADALAATRGRKLAGEPERIVLRALALDDHNLKALSLAGSAALERGDGALAQRHWLKLKQLAPQSELARQIEPALATAQRAAASSAPQAKTGG